MKKIVVLIITLVFCLSAFSQVYDTTKLVHYRYTYGNWYPRIKIDSVLDIPRDTTRSKTGFANVNGDPYFGNDTLWKAPVKVITTNLQAGDGAYFDGTGIIRNAANLTKTGVVGNVTVIDNGNLSYTVLYPQGYFIAGVYYQPGSGTITLPVGTAGVDSGRVDYIVLTAAGPASVQGANSGNPQVPVPDITTQIPITTVLILSTNTVAAPTSTSSYVLVYDENVGQPTEAAVTTSGTVTINANSTAQVKHSSKSIAVSAFTAGARIDMTFAAAKSKSDYNYITGYIYISTAWTAATTYSIRLFNGGTFTNTVALNTWGITPTLTGTWQPFAIPISEFTGSATFTGISIARSGTGGTVSWYVDYIQLQKSGFSTVDDGTAVTGGFRRSDSVFFLRKNGSSFFAYKDSSGASGQQLFKITAGADNDLFKLKGDTIINFRDLISHTRFKIGGTTNAPGNGTNSLTNAGWVGRNISSFSINHKVQVLGYDFDFDDAAGTLTLRGSKTWVTNDTVEIQSTYKEHNYDLALEAPPTAWTNLNFTTNTNITNLGSNTWTSTANSTWNQYGLASASIAADGRYAVQYKSTDGYNIVIGWNTSNTSETYTGYEYGIYLADGSGNIKDLTSGAAGSTRATVSTNTWVCLHRVGTTVTLETSPDKVTWTVVYTFGGSSTGTLYQNIAIFSSVTGDFKAYFPQYLNE